MADSKHNHILLITTDQQRFDTIAAAGNPCIRTPHLNWLCDNGVRFARAYSDAPICVPARYTIMTGRHAYNQQTDFNCWNPSPIDRSRTIPGLLTAGGFQTRAQGKMHFRPERDNLGFEHMELLADYYRMMARHPHLGTPMNHGLGQNEMEPGVSTVDETNSLTHWTVDRSIDFLETRDELRPFFLWTSFSKPHPPWDPCLPYWLTYRDAQVPAPVYGDWSAGAADVPTGFMDPTWHLNSSDRFPPELITNCRRAYYGLITQIDYNLGVLLSRMREMDLLDSTTIIFTTDHGEMLGDHHMGAKTLFFEGSAHIPMVIKPAKGLLPEESRGSVCDSLVCLADVLPTCLQAAGVAMPKGHEIDGISLLDAVTGKASRKSLCGESLDFHCWIEWPYKYHFTTLGGAELLFDMDRDPMEQHDLIRAGTHAKVRDELRAKLTNRLSAYKHPAVKSGKLEATKPAPEAKSRRGSWPGFHSAAEPSDVHH